jgi:hypothetical protein
VNYPEALGTMIGSHMLTLCSPTPGCAPIPQGSLRAYIPPNKRTKEGPKIMERGEIGWAGGWRGLFYDGLGA